MGGVRRRRLHRQADRLGNGIVADLPWCPGTGLVVKSIKAPFRISAAPFTNRVYIRAIDEYGQEHEGTKLIEIVP